jgi:hypothetical protein
VQAAPPSRGVTYLIRAVIFAVVTVVALLMLHPWPRHGLDRVRHLVSWADCGEIRVSRPRSLGWRHAMEIASAECGGAGPFFIYARFPTHAALARDLLRRPPAGAVCIAGNEVVLDGLDSGEFPKLCRKLHGHDVDSTGSTIRAFGTDSDALAFEMARHRAETAEGRALRRYLHGGTR